MPVRQGALPPVTGIKFGATDIIEARLGTIQVWLKSLLRDDFNTPSSPGMGPNWVDHGPAVAPYQAYVDPAGYSRINIPFTGLISPGVAVQTSRWRYSAAVAPADDSYLEVKIGPMGTWLPQYISRAYLRGSNSGFTDGVGLAFRSSGQVQFSILIGSTETLVDIPNGTFGPGDVLRLIPSNRQFVLTKNGRWLGSWTDTGLTTQKGLGFRSVLVSYMGSKDGPVGVQHFSPAFDYIEAGGGAAGLSISALGFSSYTWTRDCPIWPGNDYSPKADDLVLVFVNNTEPARPMTLPAGWTNLLGAGNAVISSPGSTCAAFWHLVTLAEEQAGTNSWLIPGLWNGNGYGGIYTVVVRGADPAAPINAFASNTSVSATTPFVLPGLSGAALKDRSLVLGWAGADKTPGFPKNAAPAGWVVKAVDQAGTGGFWGWAPFDDQAILQRDALTQAGVPVLPANVITGGSNNYCAVTVAVAVKPST